LTGRRVGDLGASVPDHRDEQAGQAVEITLAALVVDVRALAAGDHGDVVVGVRRHPREVHPQVALGGLLQRLGVEAVAVVGHRVPQV
jgi:hypothetical protein